MKAKKKTKESDPQREPWVKTAAACRHLGISKLTLRRWIAQELLNPKRTPGGEYRFRISELDDLLD